MSSSDPAVPRLRRGHAAPVAACTPTPPAAPAPPAPSPSAPALRLRRLRQRATSHPRLVPAPQAPAAVSRMETRCRQPRWLEYAQKSWRRVTGQERRRERRYGAGIYGTRSCGRV
ncbi:hypothetical protein PVAP13_J107101 [Panicum virgatum]|nr:hypothetical protein PVAP13_J107101 [Panicum virgatum]